MPDQWFDMDAIRRRSAEHREVRRRSEEAPARAASAVEDAARQLQSMIGEFLAAATALGLESSTHEWVESGDWETYEAEVDGPHRRARGLPPRRELFGRPRWSVSHPYSGHRVLARTWTSCGESGCSSGEEALIVGTDGSIYSSVRGPIRFDEALNISWDIDCRTETSRAEDVPAACGKSLVAWRSWFEHYLASGEPFDVYTGD